MGNSSVAQQVHCSFLRGTADKVALSKLPHAITLRRVAIPPTAGIGVDCIKDVCLKRVGGRSIAACNRWILPKLKARGRGLHQELPPLRIIARDDESEVQCASARHHRVGGV